MLKIVTLERFSDDLEMEPRKENRNSKRTEIVIIIIIIVFIQSKDKNTYPKLQ